MSRKLRSTWTLFFFNSWVLMANTVLLRVLDTRYAYLWRWFLLNHMWKYVNNALYLIIILNKYQTRLIFHQIPFRVFLFFSNLMQWSPVITYSVGIKNWIVNYRKYATTEKNIIIKPLKPLHMNIKYMFSALFVSKITKQKGGEILDKPCKYYCSKLIMSFWIEVSPKKNIWRKIVDLKLLKFLIYCKVNVIFCFIFWIFLNYFDKAFQNSLNQIILYGLGSSTPFFPIFLLKKFNF